MTSASEHSKATRGIKRSCQACEVRFYDLARASIACPACGATYTPAPQPTVQAGTRGGSQTGKAGWRSKPFERRPPVSPAAVPDAEGASERASGEDAVDDTTKDIVVDDDVLEQEEDGATELIDEDAEDSNER